MLSLIIVLPALHLPVTKQKARCESGLQLRVKNERRECRLSGLVSDKVRAGVL